MIKKIRVDDLEPGMHVCDFNMPWLRHPFLPSRMTVRRAREIDRMRRAGMTEVYIDTRLGRDSARAVPAGDADREVERRIRRDAAEAPAEGPAAPRVPFAQEFRRARRIYARARQGLRTQFDRVRSGRPVDAEQAQDDVAGMIDSLFRNRDALLCLARIKHFDQYTFEHSLNVAVLSLHLAIRLGILDRELLRLGIGAVLHDLGKVRLPEGLIQKRGPFTDAEYALVKTHPALGARLLLETRSVPTDCAAVALRHHERYDGSGYPRELAGVSVGKFGLIAAVADVYDAMTTDRPYQKGMSPTRALQKIYGWAGTHFHPLYVRKFIQCVGVYPVGSVVALDTGEIAVVTCQNRTDLLRPWVRLVRDAQGLPLDRPADADLRAPDPRGEKPFARAVARVLPPRAAGLDVAAVLTRAPGGAGTPAPHSAAA